MNVLKYLIVMLFLYCGMSNNFSCAMKSNINEDNSQAMSIYYNSLYSEVYDDSEEVWQQKKNNDEYINDKSDEISKIINQGLSDLIRKESNNHEETIKYTNKKCNLIMCNRFLEGINNIILLSKCLSLDQKQKAFEVLNATLSAIVVDPLYVDTIFNTPGDYGRTLIVRTINDLYDYGYLSMYDVNNFFRFIKVAIYCTISLRQSSAPYSAPFKDGQKIKDYFQQLLETIRKIKNTDNSCYTKNYDVNSLLKEVLDQSYRIYPMILN